jgi:predicted permease
MTIKRWWRFLRRSTLERQLDAEMRFHLEQRVSDLVRAGVPADEARRRAAVEFGGVEQIKEQWRDDRRPLWLAELAQDLRYGLRTMGRNRLVSAAVIVTIAIGVGANAAVFSVVDAIVFRPLRLPHPEQLAVIWKGPLNGPAESGVAPANAIELRDRVRTLAPIAPFTLTVLVVQQPGNDAEQIQAMRVASTFLTTVGVQPAIGRDFQADEDRVGAAHVAIISHALWLRQFGGDPAIIGRTVSAGGERSTVIGVMPAGFQFPELFGTAFHPDLWLPLRFPPEEAVVRGAGYVFLLGRRASQQSWDAVQGELDEISRAFARTEPSRYTDRHLMAIPVHERVVGSVRTLLFLLWAAVSCVLLIACANVANILLSRATSRGRELAVRGSLGASRARLVRQLLTESLVLGGAAALCGVAVAALLVRAWSVALTDLLPRAGEIAMDPRVVAFATLAALTTSLVVGLLPAWQLSQVAPQVALRQLGPARGGTKWASRLRSGLLIGQIAMAVLLVSCAGLLVRSFAAVQRVDLGFAPNELLTFQVPLSGARASTGQPETTQSAATFYEQLIDRLNALPHVRSAGALSLLPLRDHDFTWTFLARDKPAPAGAMLPHADICVATPGALETLQVPMSRGRTFTRGDQAASLPVAIVNETLARTVWPGEDPIGKQLKLEGPITMLPWMTVVGVSADVHFDAPDRGPQPAIYRPNTQHRWTSMGVIVRTAGPSAAVVPSIRALLQSIDANVPILQMRDFSYYLSRSVAQRRVVMAFVALFAGVALMLALIGVYSMFAYVVSLRTREIGIRIALGARQADVPWLVLRQALAIGSLGLLAGTAATLAARRVIGTQVFGVGPSDPVTLALVGALTLTTALLASYLATRRAARVDPTLALRME